MESGSLRELSPVDERPGSSERLSMPRVNVPPSSPALKHRTRQVIKSASASGLSLMIPTGKTTTRCDGLVMREGIKGIISVFRK